MEFTKSGILEIFFLKLHFYEYNLQLISKNFYEYLI